MTATSTSSGTHPISDVALGCLSMGEPGKEAYQLLPAGATRLKLALAKLMGTPDFQTAMRALLALACVLDSQLACKGAALALLGVTEAVAKEANAKGLIPKPSGPRHDAFLAPPPRR